LTYLTYGGSAGAARGSRMTLLHTILSSMSVSSSPVVSTPVSFNRLSTYVALGRPLPLCPWTGFQRITLDSGNSGWRIACPAWKCHHKKLHALAHPYLTIFLPSVCLPYFYLKSTINILSTVQLRAIQDCWVWVGRHWFLS
jgi:hypothetical protein